MVYKRNAIGDLPIDTSFSEAVSRIPSVAATRTPPLEESSIDLEELEDTDRPAAIKAAFETRQSAAATKEQKEKAKRVLARKYHDTRMELKDARLNISKYQQVEQKAQAAIESMEKTWDNETIEYARNWGKPKPSI